MMKINYMILLLLISFNSCKSQNLKTCNTELEYEFKGEEIPNNKKIILVLETGFQDDYLKIYLNDTIIKQGNFSTDREFGTAGEIIDYDYTKQPPSFKIEYNNQCLVFTALADYRIIFLHKGDKNWTIEYRNEFKIIE